MYCRQIVNKSSCAIEFLVKLGPIECIHMACHVDPCQSWTCPNFPDSTCSPSPCSGCTPVFRDQIGNVIPQFACQVESKYFSI